MVSSIGLVRHNVADIMKSEKICDSTIMSVTHSIVESVISEST